MLLKVNSWALVYHNFVLVVMIKQTNECVLFGHVISASLDDKADIWSKRNSLCGKINNVLCYFHKCDPVVKLKLLRSYCSDVYGSVLWDQAMSLLHGVKG